ncbi:MAG: DUF3298 and DUF4163 domain-containing protein [Gemmatimonadaceae bacterium]
MTGAGRRRRPERAPGATVASVATIVAAVLTAACGGAGDGAAADSAAAAPLDTLAHTERVVERADGDCRRDDMDTVVTPCVTVVIRYPEITGAPAPALIDSVRAFVIGVAAAAPGVSTESEPAPSVDAVAARFVADYNEYSAEVPSELPRPWLLEREVRVVCNTPSIVSLRADESSYTGGAHGMTVARLASFDPLTGRRLRLGDWVSDGEAARVAGERAFRDQRDIADGQSLARVGFSFFEDGRFALSENVMRCGDVLTFHYDPYEIGPYVMGPTDLELPLSAIADSTRPD